MRGRGGEAARVSLQVSPGRSAREEAQGRAHGRTRSLPPTPRTLCTAAGVCGNGGRDETACEPPVRSSPTSPVTASMLRTGDIVQTALLRSRLHDLTPSSELPVAKARGVVAWVWILACWRDTWHQQGPSGTLRARRQPGVCSAVTRANRSSNSNLQPQFY